MNLRRLANLGLLLVLLGAALVAVSRIQNDMNEMRVKAKLVPQNKFENPEPAVAFVQVALGAFRGLLVDLLFLRASQLQDRGQYFELVQLASLMTKLQPDFTGAHSFLAWNMAYNISVTFSDYDDRWRWVQRGIELLRDEAIPYHPGDPKLYQQLGWIYQHKMGHMLDDAHYYYKSQLALQLTQVVGTRYPPDWQALAEAPGNREALRARLGERAAALDRALNAANLTLEQLEDEFRRASAFPEALGKALAEAGLDRDLELYLRSRWLRDKLRLNPGHIVRLIKKYGELDFRLPDAHAIYWASKGLDAVPERKDVDCERMLGTSISNAFRAGRLMYVAKDGFPFIGPNPNLADATRQQYLDNMKSNPDNSGFRAGYENFMKDAVVILYGGGYMKKAQEFLNYLRQDFPTTEDYRRDLDSFALRLLDEDISDRSLRQVNGLIASLVHSAYLAAAIGDQERAVQLENAARRVHAIYGADLAPGTRLERRKGLPSFDQFRRNTLQMCLESFPEPLPDRLRQALGITGPLTDSSNLLELKDLGKLPVQPR